MSAPADDRAGGRRFRVCTVVTRPGQYAEMRASFGRAGFGPAVARFDAFDNAAGNRHDPYALLRELPGVTPEPYLVLCHQDVLLDRGHGRADLERALDDLTRRDPAWAVAGNAGCTERLELVQCVTGPRGTERSAGLPRRVVSLDENLLIVRTGRSVGCSPGLGGFHLYGTDLCLNATLGGASAYVVDFHLNHLSAGDPSGPAFEACRDALQRAWDRRFVLGVVNTPCTHLTFSRYGWLRRAFADDHTLRRRAGVAGCAFIPSRGAARHLAGAAGSTVAATVGKLAGLLRDRPDGGGAPSPAR